MATADRQLTTDSRSKRSHTQGPWHIGIGGMLHANRVWTKDMRPVANLCSMGTAPPDLDSEAQANGRLIAAAPEMLQMLRELLPECGECEGSGRMGAFVDNVPGDITKGVHEVEIDCDQCADIRALIAKAEGRS